ncbi:MAG: DUF488 family protein [Thermoanaerobaculia bacterium]|nr:DUF488 family protein [Thermoanaerobaculia bacterium]
MSLRVVRLGSARHAEEGLRIGTVRRPPRGVPKERFAEDDWYDLWLPQLAPSAELVKRAQSASSEAEWRAFERKYRAEMTQPDNGRLIALLAALSRRTNLSVGCYCDDESRCHRSVLADLLAAEGAEIEPG